MRFVNLTRTILSDDEKHHTDPGIKVESGNHCFSNAGSHVLKLAPFWLNRKAEGKIKRTRKSKMGNGSWLEWGNHPAPLIRDFDVHWRWYIKIPLVGPSWMKIFSQYQNFLSRRILSLSLSFSRHYWRMHEVLKNDFLEEFSRYLFDSLSPSLR